MIRHCAMFKWAEGVSDEDMAAIRAGLDRLATLDFVADYTHGPDAGLADNDYDYAVVADFVTVEDYRAYTTEEGHRRLIADLIRPNIAGRAGIQYEH